MEKTWCSHSCFSKTNPNCHEDIVNDSELRTGLKLNLYTHLQLKTLPNTAPVFSSSSHRPRIQLAARQLERSFPSSDFAKERTVNFLKNQVSRCLAAELMVWCCESGMWISCRHAWCMDTGGLSCCGTGLRVGGAEGYAQPLWLPCRIRTGLLYYSRCTGPMPAPSPQLGAAMETL